MINTTLRLLWYNTIMDVLTCRKHLLMNEESCGPNIIRGLLHCIFVVPKCSFFIETLHVFATPSTQHFRAVGHDLERRQYRVDVLTTFDYVTNTPRSPFRLLKQCQLDCPRGDRFILTIHLFFKQMNYLFTLFSSAAKSWLRCFSIFIYIPVPTSYVVLSHTSVSDTAEHAI